ncbi:hypothetical protein SNE40_023473 [Patella caerulea]|uniref:Reelin domain-containing protein n=1 Tax=Patella caerulea TaxID=87958 RepID=A0AAN8IX15_PATCE
MLVVYFVGLLTVLVESYPTGAPPSSCDNLLPHHHGTSPQETPSPYTFYVDSNTYTPQSSLVVSVFGSPAFLSFIIQGRRSDTGAPVGTFVKIPANTKYLLCDNQRNSVTHSNPTPRNITQFIWVPPTENVGEIIFKGSVARSKSLYWGVLESKPIKYSKTAPTGGSNSSRLSNSSLLSLFIIITMFISSFLIF